MSSHDPIDDLPMDEILVKIQALADNELPESEIDSVLDAIQGSYEYREEYAALLKLRRSLGAGPAGRPSEDWLAKAERKISRRLSRGIGTLLFIGSTVVLLGYATVSLFRDPDVPLIVSVLTAGGAVGVAVLLASAIADRVRERKTDKYRGIMR
jgi:hypothetical protein